MPDIFQLGADIADMAKTVASADDKVKLAEVAIALNQLALENRRLVDENDGLRKQLASRKKLEYRDGSYYVIEDDGTEVGPVCPECYLKKGLIYLTVGSQKGSRYTTCNAIYGGATPATDGYKARAHF